jgi:hypothetical protein
MTFGDDDFDFDIDSDSLDEYDLSHTETRSAESSEEASESCDADKDAATLGNAFHNSRIDSDANSSCLSPKQVYSPAAADSDDSGYGGYGSPAVAMDIGI